MFEYLDAYKLFLNNSSMESRYKKSESNNKKPRSSSSQFKESYQEAYPLDNNSASETRRSISISPSANATSIAA